MTTLKTWKIEDQNGNSIGFTAPSKSKAVAQYKRIFPTGRIKTVTNEGEAHVPRKMKIPLPGVKDKDEFKPIETVRNKDRFPGPNEPCSCGSGKKYKRCCMRKPKKAQAARA